MEEEEAVVIEGAAQINVHDYRSLNPILNVPVRVQWKNELKYWLPGWVWSGETGHKIGDANLLLYCLWCKGSKVQTGYDALCWDAYARS